MRYRWAIWAAIILVPVGATLMGGQGGIPGPPADMPGGGPPSRADEIRLVMEAVSLLDHTDYMVVRGAIGDLGDLIHAPNIAVAVSPLEKVLTMEERYYDTYTRGMAARALVRIGFSLDNAVGDGAISLVISELETGQSESVRASCAYSLGLSGNDLAYAPLVTANENDPSPLVRGAACEGLILLTNGHYDSETCGYENGAAVQSLRSSLSYPAVTSTESPPSSPDGYDETQIKWLRTHILLPVEYLLPQDSDQPDEQK